MTRADMTRADVTRADVATLRVDPAALRAAADSAAHDSWTVRLAADDLARALAAARARLGAAAEACEAGVRPLIDAALRVADSEARLAEALRTLASAYPAVDGRCALGSGTGGQHRSPAHWG